MVVPRGEPKRSQGPGIFLVVVIEQVRNVVGSGRGGFGRYCCCCCCCFGEEGFLKGFGQRVGVVVGKVLVVGIGDNAVVVVIAVIVVVIGCGDGGDDGRVYLVLAAHLGHFGG